MRVVQPDVARTGITEGLRIAAAVRAEGADVTWHVGTCSPLAAAVSWAVASTHPTHLLQEHQLDLQAATGALVAGPLDVRDGHGVVPTTPGSGVEVLADAVAASSVRRCDLRA